MLEYRENCFSALSLKKNDTELTGEERSALRAILNTSAGVAVNKVIDRLGVRELKTVLSKDGTDWNKGAVDVLKELKREFNIEVNKNKK